MSPIHTPPLPAHALLQRYRQSGAYTDCYAIDLPAPVACAQYVLAFYTTPLFKVERLILGLARMPSTDLQARRVAEGSTAAFAAWRVEDRTPDQLLMCDVYGRTRSWFMTAPIPDHPGAATRLYFGSAVVRGSGPGRQRGFDWLLGLHKLYSRALLRSAWMRLG